MRDDLDRNRIQRQMAGIRGDLDVDVSRVVDRTRRLVDYRYYLRQHPWLSVGAIFLVGFIAVPQRPRIVVPDADQLAELAKCNQLIVKERPKPTKSQGLAQTAVLLLGNLLGRAALGYVMQKTRRFD